jgi:GNAT superfamily N-acetyltransferase
MTSRQVIASNQNRPANRQPMRNISVQFEPASAQDADDLAALRVMAMRPSLERLGRFDPQRARDGFLASFTPASTRHLVVDGHRVAFVVVRHYADHLLLDHLYVHPAHQGQGSWDLAR